MGDRLLARRGVELWILWGGQMLPSLIDEASRC